MLELELFFKIVESEIRRKHIKYLKKQKCISDAEEPPAESDENAAGEFPSDEKRQHVKRFNQGIDTALKVLRSEFVAFNKRIEKEVSEASKF